MNTLFPGISPSLPSSLHMGRVGFDVRKFFSLGWQVTRVPPYGRRPFPSKENRQISERDDLGPPVVLGGQEIGLGSRNLRPRTPVQGGGTSHWARRL
jgi:hypothetical protein